MQNSQCETVTWKKAKKTSAKQSEHLEKDRLKRLNTATSRSNETAEH